MRRNTAYGATGLSDPAKRYYWTCPQCGWGWYARYVGVNPCCPRCGPVRHAERARLYAETKLKLRAMDSPERRETEKAKQQR